MNHQEKNDGDDGNTNKTKRWLLWIAVLAVIAIIAVWGFYFWNFRYSLSDNQNVWGTFGDFVGGALNPILAFLGLIALLWTIMQNQIELKATHKELRIANEHYDRQYELQKNEEKKDDIINVVFYLHGQINSLLDKEKSVNTINGLFSLNELFRITSRGQNPIHLLTTDSTFTISQHTTSNQHTQNNRAITKLTGLINNIATYIFYFIKQSSIESQVHIQESHGEEEIINIDVMKFFKDDLHTTAQFCYDYYTQHNQTIPLIGIAITLLYVHEKKT